MTKQLFLSHAWGKDNLNRNNHERCKEISNKLKERQYSIWFDDNEMYGNIDSAIMKGIDGASAILLCLTEKYCNKINNAINNNLLNDNCYKEWNYSLFKQKLIIPIIMDPTMKDIYINRPGVIQMYLHSTLYIDASHDIDMAVNTICDTLKKHSINKLDLSKKFNSSCYFNSFKYKLNDLTLSKIQLFKKEQNIVEKKIVKNTSIDNFVKKNDNFITTLRNNLFLGYILVTSK